MRTKGFSLVELSIVLVILGLLAGGILSGQALIHAAELRSYNTANQNMLTALKTFQDKYFGIPGDLNNATSFWGTAGGDGSDAAACQYATPSGIKTCNGDGNGGVTGFDGFTERFRFWQHLANAGMIEGSFTGQSTDSSGHTYVNKGGTNAPKLKSGNTFTIFQRTSAGTGVGDYFVTTAPQGLYLEMRKEGDTSTNQSQWVLKPEDVWNLDTKFDDGKPTSGILLSAARSFSKNPSTTQYCSTTDDASAVYNLSEQGLICRYDIRLN